jgi:hypothetical protein
MQGVSGLGFLGIPRSALNGQKARRSKTSYLRQLHDSPLACSGVGSAAAGRAGEGGGRLGPLNGIVGSEQAREAGAGLYYRLDS